MQSAHSGFAKWRVSAPQTHLWLIKHWFSASTFVVKIATLAKPENVSGNFATPPKNLTGRKSYKELGKTKYS